MSVCVEREMDGFAVTHMYSDSAPWPEPEKELGRSFWVSDD